MRRGPRLVLVMAANDLRRRLRDRSALITAFVAPFVLASIISVALGAAGGGLDAEIGVVDADRSEVSRALATGLLENREANGGPRRQGSIRFVAIPSERQALERIDAAELGAALILPAGFGRALATGQPEPVRVVRDADQPITGEVATSIADAVAARLDVTNLAVALAAASVGQAPTGDRLAQLVNRARSIELPVTVRETAPADDDVSLASYFGPSMAIVFLFVTVGFAAQSLLVERRSGTLARLRAAPTSVSAIVGAKTVSMFVLGLASMLTLWLATSAVFGAPWGDPAAVLVLCVATVFSIAGLSTLVTSLVRTEAQAEGYTSMLTFTLAILGGNFVTPGALPDALRRLALLTPNGWALRAFTELSSGGGGLGDIVPTLAVLATIGVVAGGVALGLLQRLVRS